MKYLLTIPFFLTMSYSFSQVLIWNDDFNGTAIDWDITLQPSPNDANANIWKINDEEGGVAPPGCGVAGNGNNTLHVGCQGAACIGTGAVYFAGDAGMSTFPAVTDIRAAYTVAIPTLGETNLEFVFDWIGVGQAGQDFAEVEYSIDGGTSWNVIWTQTAGATCGTGQGEWAEETVALPVAAENQGDLRFAFHWVNDNDGAGTDPSFAVNNLRLFAAGTPPTASFTATSFNICEGDCIDFTDNSIGTNISAWNWTFNGGTPSSSTGQNPTNVCFATAGTYDVTLTVTDDNGTDNITQQINVTACGSGPTANFTASSTNICEGDCIDLSDNSVGTNVSGWDWAFNGATPVSSTSQNPTNICYSAAGNYDITLTVTDDNGTDNITQSITVSNCSTNPPVADFSIDTNVICKGDCISFTDLSTDNPTSWNWTFEEGNPSTSAMQSPDQVCFDSVGTFDVTLTVTNANGSDQSTTSITVLDIPQVDGYGDTIIDIGGAAELTASFTDFGEFFWDPSDNLDCDTCLYVIATPYLTTTYYPTLIAPSGCIGRDTVLVIVNFEEIVEVPSAFSPNGDGLNDRLYVKGIGIVSIDFKIFNRYGQLVYTGTDIEEGWDGTLNGEPLNQGVFVYTLEFNLINGQSGERSGNVTLVK
jgi:gliding motility-associated-like protein